METKQEIRKRILRERDSLPKQERAAYSVMIAKKMKGLSCYQSAAAVFAYVSYKSEVDTAQMIAQAFCDGKAVFAPKVCGEEMAFWKLENPNDLKEGYKGILEPKGRHSFIDWLREREGKEKVLMWMPGTAFDKTCSRIGYGKGFYDRYLAKFAARYGTKVDLVTAGLCFSCQMVEQIPVEKYDVRPDFILSERGIIVCREKKQSAEKTAEGEGMEYLNDLGRRAKEAKYGLQKLAEKEKNGAILAVSEALRDKTDKILSENEKDYAAAKENGMSEGLLDRLKLSESRIQAMAKGLEQIASLPDPIGEVMERFDRPNGLHIEKVRVPMGVIGIIYEARPNVTADAFGLCFKTGNAVILKGGKDALFSNRAITETIREALEKRQINPDAVSLITDNDRSVTTAFMKLKEYVDILIPRGGAGLIRAVVENSTIPVIETGTGNCHIYVDEAADIEKAIPIILNAKTQRIGVCNACESLLVHEKIADKFLPLLGRALQEKNVEIRGDERVVNCIEGAVGATQEDYGTEYLDFIVSIKTVASVKEAVEHINRYSTGHSEAILTENKENAAYFLKGVDSACVYVNASTRFTDGFEFGFGAEIGISTQKLHARGPMGLKELTSYKYEIMGDGQIRS